MKPPVVHQIGDAHFKVYYMDAGDRIPRHKHAIPHKTCVIVGKARVVVFANPAETTVLTQTDPAIELPAYIDHEILALCHGTIVMNGTDLTTLPPPPPAPSGVVMMAPP